MSARKIDSKTFAMQKRRRRQWLTFVRMIRYGVNNFSRNAWLTIAATAVMTITLLIILTTLAARQVLTDTVTSIREKVDISIYLESDTTEAQSKEVISKLEGLSSVRTVSYITPAQARETYIEENKSNPRILAALNESITAFPGTVRVNVEDINDISQLKKFVETDETVKQYIDETREPSFAGTMRTAIENVGRTISFAEKLGIVVSVVFIVVSSLIVFNTIRMAIFNRKEEIQMMKLIGADKSFIRGPFVVEAVVYGFIAALLATGLGVLILMSARERLESYGVAIDGVVRIMTLYSPFVLLGMIAAGALIGIISSLLATRKYLKI